MAKNKSQNIGSEQAVEAVEEKPELRLIGLKTLVIEHTIPQTRRMENPDPEKRKTIPKVDKPHPTLSKAPVEDRKIYITLTEVDEMEGKSLVEIIEGQTRIRFGIAQDLNTKWDQLEGGEKFTFSMPTFFADKEKQASRLTRIKDVRSLYAAGKLSAEAALDLIAKI